MDHTPTPPAHTPTPWFFGHSENPDVYRNEPHWLVLSDPAESTGEAIADVETGPGPETAEANAEFIVRACNSHDPLVVSLRRMTEAAGRVAACWERGDLAAAVNDLRAATSEATLVLEAMTETA